MITQLPIWCINQETLLYLVSALSNGEFSPPVEITDNLNGHTLHHYHTDMLLPRDCLKRTLDEFREKYIISQVKQLEHAIKFHAYGHRYAMLGLPPSCDVTARRYTSSIESASNCHNGYCCKTTIFHEKILPELYDKYSIMRIDIAFVILKK